MKAYYFDKAGFAISQNDQDGQHVFLGQAGRGRTPVWIRLDKFNPPDVVEGRVLDCHLHQITPRATVPGREPRPFWVLQRAKDTPTDRVYVRVNTSGRYRRNCGGSWSTHRGNPTTLVVGEGRNGDAGRLAGFDDGIVEMGPGDVLKVTIEGWYSRHALFLENGVPKQMEWDAWVALDTARTARATPPEVVFGTMPIYNYARDGFVVGVPVKDVPEGKAVVFGEEGRGRRDVTLPVIGEGVGTTLEAAAIAKVASPAGEQTHTRSSERSDQYVLLVGSDGRETGAFAVRLDVFGGGRSSVSCDKLTGEPVKIAAGIRASGTAGRAGGGPDDLWVLRTGDAVVLSSGWGEDARYAVVENRGGKPVSTPWKEWEVADGKARPAEYVAQGKAPWGHVPAEWVGRVVKIFQSTLYSHEVRVLKETFEGELVSTDPLVLNLGWDGRDRKEATITEGVWVKLDPHRMPKRLDSGEQVRRSNSQARAVQLRGQLEQARKAPWFDCIDPGLQKRVTCFLQGRSEWDDSGESKPAEFTKMATAEVESWVSEADGIYASVAQATEAAQALHVRREAGEVVVNFGGHFRRLGASGNCDHWVVTPDGALRAPDSVEYRKRYTSEGNKHWRLVEADELALEWHGGTSYKVSHRPVGGLTPAQLQAVKRIETEDLQVEAGSFGLDPAISGLQEVVEQAVAAALQELGNGRDKVATALRNCREPVETTGKYNDLMREHGISLSCDREVAALPDQAKGFPVRCCGRDAQVVRTFPTAFGEVQLVVFHKYGDWQMHVRIVQPDPTDEAKALLARAKELSDLHYEQLPDDLAEAIVVASGQTVPSDLNTLPAFTEEIGRRVKAVEEWAAARIEAVRPALTFGRTAPTNKDKKKS